MKKDDKGGGALSMTDQVLFILQTGRKLQHNIFLKQSEVFRKCLGKDVSLGQLQMIRQTHRLGETGVKELAKLLKVSAPSASAMVDRLVERGLLTRERRLDDRRQVIIRLAPRTQAAMEKLEKEVGAWIGELAERLGPATTRKWFQVMREINAVFENDGLEF